jgi:hypothetical protein
MATTTTNFGWDIPQSTDLVKDGATAIAALGQDIDTALVDLKGGTTGQILAKASNTDLDYSWVTNDVGDITAVTAGTGITGGGTTGAVTVSFDQANFGGGQYAAGKNKIINGDFGVWQRGTSFTNPANNSYTADRFFIQHDGTGATRTISQQTFTAGTAPVAGYEGTYYLRYAISAAGTGNTFNVIKQAIEDVRVYAGQSVTMSVWLKADSARSVVLNLNQFFGSGGSSEVVGASTTASVTTSWQRFTYTATLGSLSGKTIGTGSYLTFTLGLPANTTQTIEIWGAQVEASSVASPFQTATGTKQGELAACQRYYYRQNGVSNTPFGFGMAASTTSFRLSLPYKQPMRVSPSSIDFSGLQVVDTVSGYAVSNLVITAAGTDFADLTATSTGMSAQRAGWINGSGTCYIGLSAEL